MKTIELAINSQYTKKDRYGNLNCVWYENGSQHNSTVAINKNNRDYYYDKARALYDKVIASAPAANQPKVKELVDKYLEDNFTEDAYFIDAYSDDVNGMIKRLAKYM